MKSKHQRKREARRDRICANVGRIARDRAARWAATIGFYDRVLAHLAWLKDNPPTPEDLKAMGVDPED